MKRPRISIGTPIADRIGVKVAVYRTWLGIPVAVANTMITATVAPDSVSASPNGTFITCAA